MVEVLLALALAAAAVVAFADAVLVAERNAGHIHALTMARLRAGECLEAARWVRDADGWDALQSGTFGLDASSGRWELVPEPDAADGITRSMVISAYDADTKLLGCTVAWDEDTSSRSLEVTTLLAR